MRLRGLVITVTIGVVLALAISLAYAFTWVWYRTSDHRLRDQASFKPYDAPGPIASPLSAIPAGGKETTLKSKDAARQLTNPLEPTEESITRGENLFIVFCVTCHGAAGRGDGLVGEKLDTPPADLALRGVQKQTDGELYYTITSGGGAMPALKDMLTQQERWHIINFVKRNLSSVRGAPGSNDL